MIENYRSTMSGDVLHSWAQDAQEEIDTLRKEAERYRLQSQHVRIPSSVAEAKAMAAVAIAWLKAHAPDELRSNTKITGEVR